MQIITPRLILTHLGSRVLHSAHRSFPGIRRSSRRNWAVSEDVVAALLAREARGLDRGASGVDTRPPSYFVGVDLVDVCGGIKDPLAVARSSECSDEEDVAVGEGSKTAVAAAAAASKLLMKEIRGL